MVGLLIAVAILRLVWQSARAVFTRMLDGVDPEVLEAAEHAAKHVSGVHDVAEVRARWIGHRLGLELNISVNPDVTVTEGHGVAKEVRHQVLHHVPHVSAVTVHVDPATESGETFHHIDSHAHDGLPLHSHR
jgi:divalent metal cation (Fe/Co/Zn/Cd) transporter